MANTISTLQSVLGSLATNGLISVDGARQTTAQSSAAKAAAAPVAAVKTDQASLSTVGGLVARASAGSDVRQEKVSALQEAISAGTYSVSSKAVASKIVDSLLS